MTRDELIHELDRIIDVGIVNAHHDREVLQEIREQLNNPVYVVTQGCYSDYHIEGVFLNEESAKKYAAACGGELETYFQLDRADGHEEDEKLRIKYNTVSNEITEIDIIHWRDSDSFVQHIFTFHVSVGSRVGQDVILNGADSELALKVAQDRFAEWAYMHETNEDK